MVKFIKFLIEICIINFAIFMGIAWLLRKKIKFHNCSARGRGGMMAFNPFTDDPRQEEKDIIELKAENAQLRTELAATRDRIMDLEEALKEEVDKNTPDTPPQASESEYVRVRREDLDACLDGMYCHLKDNHNDKFAGWNFYNRLRAALDQGKE
jgi:regulator of replication initiation timing